MTGIVAAVAFVKNNTQNRSLTMTVTTTVTIRSTITLSLQVIVVGHNSSTVPVRIQNED